MGPCTSTGQRKNSDKVCIQTTSLTDTQGSHHLQERCSIHAPLVQEGTCGCGSVVACRSHIPCSSQSKNSVSDTVEMANVEAFYPCLSEPASWILLLLLYLTQDNKNYKPYKIILDFNLNVHFFQSWTQNFLLLVCTPESDLRRIRTVSVITHKCRIFIPDVFIPFQALKIFT